MFATPEDLVSWMVHGAPFDASNVRIVQITSTVNGTTSLAMPYPTPLVTNDLLLALVANKYPNNAPSTPAGYALVKQASGGAGASGADSGNVYISVYSKTSDGTETGNMTVTITSGNAAMGRFHQLRPSNGGTWSVAAASGASAVGDTTWSATMDADPGITAGDLVVCYSAVNGDNAGIAAAEGASLTAAGATFGRPLIFSNGTTSFADDAALTAHAFQCIAGTSSAVATYACSYASGTPAGATALVRIRAT